MAHRPRSPRALGTVASALTALLAGCLERELKPLNPCLVSGVVAEVSARNIDKIDLLFMVDNSISMRDEQDALAREFPRLIRALTSGDRDGDGEQDFPPAKDLHIGVVSSDLGLPGIHAFEGCKGLGGDGRLRATANPAIAGCSAQPLSPPYLHYVKARGDDAARLEHDFTCIATLGTDGCGFEQPLESVLKAVWPGADASRTFVADPATGFGALGNAGPGFPNGDFIRNDPSEQPSLIAIVLVTDEEDCSSRDLGHFAPNASPHGPNTRCYHEGQRPEPNNLFDVERYIQSFKALRPGNEDLVIFAGIVGVPERLVTREERAKFDFDKPAEADAFFDHVLAAPEMQEEIDTKGTADPSDDNLRPSCGGGPDATAYPPRRIVQVAKGFGKNGVIQSICQDDFGPAMDAIIDAIAAQLGTVCLPRPLVRSRDGLVECNVIWELPRAPIGDAPTRCDERPFLAPPDPGRADRGEDGGAACKVTQLPVLPLAAPNERGESLAPGPVQVGGELVDQGWYYDEFSGTTQRDCKLQATKQRVAFTPLAQPPTGVKVKLECLNEVQSLARPRTDAQRGIEQPAIGTPCDAAARDGRAQSGDDACVVTLAAPVNGSFEDRGMFCHAEQQVCVQACATDADCPAAWVCDARPETLLRSGGRAHCTNPTCGTGQD